jgi:hypothetical protein
MRSRTIGEALKKGPVASAELRITTARRRAGRVREKRPRPELTRPAAVAQPPVQPPVEPNPVRIAVLAMENLGRASLRASCTGTEVYVEAPDEATAAIFRAALTETGRTRVTDRLIRVVVD